ncbi:hypothetical protein CONLIGDRAFT_714525 [Coniochaeta ligniaria NRRL 30616]|uniref:Uncharacterized protein n=1 Tax=Coniochaeta ligniaria NRRL 30616 TaxID=1408157 RepID=A0A1J7JQS4_9PEZI|nr:hypothetical protein CONLIGDRAFT_714525 [Coniochaeta ligniaria NRRL 30616]
MKASTYTIIPTLLGLTSLASGAACNADNCLRAIRNVAKPGVPDCQAFMWTTVTPLPITTVQTLSGDLNATETSSITLSTVIPATETSTVEETETETETSTVIATTQLPPINKKRADPTIPAYASPCSGEVRYSSACSCLGVTASTVILATPIATSTASITETHSVTETLTASTEIVTSTATTLTETATDATTTLTTLVTSTTTLAAASTPVPTWFYIQAVGGTSDGWLLQSQSNPSANTPFTFGSNAANGAQFGLVDGKLFDGNGYPVYYTYNPQSPYTSSVSVSSAGRTALLPAQASTRSQVSCSVQDDSTLDCTNSYPYSQGVGICGGTFRLFRDANLTNTASWCSSASITPSTVIKAVPATTQFVKARVVGGSHDGEWMYIDAATQQIRFGPWTSVTASIFTFALSPLYPTFNAVDGTTAGSSRTSMTFGNDWSYVYYGATPAGVPLPDNGQYWIPPRLWVTETSAPYNLVGQPGLMQGRTSFAVCGDSLIIYVDGADPAGYCPGAEKIQLEAVPAVIPWTI